MICSDIHRNMDNYKQAITLAGRIDRIIIAGDLVEAPEHFRREAGMLPVVMVQGNCDRYLDEQLPFDVDFTVEGLRFFVTHGHRYGEPDRWRLFREARRREAQIVVYGHTHMQTAYDYKGIRFINPGTLKKDPSRHSGGGFAVLTVDRGKILSLDFF